MSNNGKADPGSPFAFIGAKFAVMSRDEILESLARDGLLQGKENLAAGPVFRLTADNFRDWAKAAEPGGMFRAPEVGLHIIRLSRFAPMATSLSEEAQKRIDDAQADPQSPNDRPLIFHG